MSTNNTTTADLFYTLRKDQIRLADALVSMTHAIYLVEIMLMLYAFIAWINLSGWSAKFAGATFLSIAVVFAWCLYHLPSRATELITDLGPASEPPGEEPPQ